MVGVFYQLHSNEANCLKVLWMSWTFLDSNPDVIYDITNSILELILIIIFIRKLADLPYLWLFLQSNPASFLEQTVTTLGKNVTRHIISFFCWKMIRVVHAIFVIIIEDLEMHFNHANLPLRKSAICFEPLAQKRETGKQKADMLY